MAHYTTTQTFPDAESSYNVSAPQQRLTVQANGGTVTVATCLDGTDWIDALVLDADSDQDILVAGRRIRITPAGGAEYNFGPGVEAG